MNQSEQLTVNRKQLKGAESMASQQEVDCIVKGIELSWTTWGSMRGEQLVLGEVSYVKSENGEGIERIFAVNIGANQESRIEQMIADVKEKRLPDSILITPYTKPENLAEILTQKGFLIDDAAPCMMMELDDYEEKPVEYAGFTISEVTEKGQLTEWLAIVSEALFGCELVKPEQMADALALDSTRFYMGALDGKPVTACMTIAGGGTSVLEMVATLEEYRRKGFASAAIGKALADLREQGIPTVSLRAEADGVGVYRKLGFSECFRRVVATYEWKNT